MDYLTTRKPEEMSLSAYKKHAKRQGAELLCNITDLLFRVGFRAHGHTGKLMTFAEAKWSLFGHSRALN